MCPVLAWHESASYSTDSRRDVACICCKYVNILSVSDSCNEICNFNRLNLVFGIFLNGLWGVTADGVGTPGVYGLHACRRALSARRQQAIGVCRSVLLTML